MEPLSSTLHTQETSTTTSLEQEVTLVSIPQQENTSTPSKIHHTKNLYPVVRHTLLLICVLFSLALILLLMHQNGKSIYDNGI